MLAESGSTVVAVLGPTNTGKTHRAVERMLEHESAIIGLPLRLLAREVYDRATAVVGEAAVALVTGEEKRVPERPRYWVCTVEAMPEGREVDFVAVDEIQLAGHPERGHVFTDRLLNWRGRRETWFMGSDTMRPLVERLVPVASIEGRPRLSTLSGVGSLGLGALPPRSAVVAFSAARVYELGERLRARHGGVAVVLGALSPRTRNAQVALYQSGEVDYMVATDAIGMGLNMDVDCVAFADLQKFDGRRTRELVDAELAQIAGRAGRYHNNGRFATLAPLPALGRSVTRAIEQHRFPVQERIFWRNRDLDFASVDSLLAALRRTPRVSCLQPVDDAEDFRALAHLMLEPAVVARARGAGHVALLWEVCQIPDFRQLQLDDHHQLLGAVFMQLSGVRGRLDPDWMERHIAPLGTKQGDLDTLLQRLAFIRTWTYIANHPRWVESAAAWQERTRAIEDDLSDALHAELVRRFVDAAKPGARGRRAGPRHAAASPRSFGELLRARLGQVEEETERSSAGGGAHRGWVDEVLEAPHHRFSLDGSGRILDGGVVLGRLVAGADLLHPEVSVHAVAVGGGERLRLHRRLVAWARDAASLLLAELRGAESDAGALSGAGRGVLYQLEQGLGTVQARAAREQLRCLAAQEREVLERRGVRLGEHVLFAPALLAPAAVRTRLGFCSACLPPGVRLDPPRPGATSFPVRSEIPQPIYTAIGYPVFGARAIRADVAETVGRRILAGAPVRELASRLGCRAREIPAISRAFEDAAGVPHRRPPPSPRPTRHPAGARRSSHR